MTGPRPTPDAATRSNRLLVLVQERSSYRALKPVCDELSSEFDVHLLLTDFLFGTTGEAVSLDPSEFDYPAHDASEYVRLPERTGFPERLRDALVQRLVFDAVHSLAYDFGSVFRELTPDAVLASSDNNPFHRQLFHRAAERGVPTFALQHGFFRYDLQFDHLGGHPFLPTLRHPVPGVESLKRRLLYRYGVTEFCNPYTSAVLSLGERFTDRISRLRAERPTDGRGTVVTTGSPEYEGSPSAYDPTVDSVLFLSQQFLEGGGGWGWSRQEWLVERLGRLDDRYDVTVRPHPKDSAEKRDHFRETLRVSEGASLVDDIADHDAVLTVDSTALIEGVVRGKPCAVLRPPGFERVTEYPPFEHEHVVHVGREPVDLARAAADRSTATRDDWLEQFCYLPGADLESDHEGSASLAASVVRRGVRE